VLPHAVLTLQMSFSSRLQLQMRLWEQNTDRRKPIWADRRMAKSLQTHARKQKRISNEVICQFSQMSQCFAVRQS
jgi:hypothetical protein